MRTRRATAAIVGVLVAALVALDVATSEAPDIYDQPALVAYGSGQASGGAHCASLPSD